VAGDAHERIARDGERINALVNKIHLRDEDGVGARHRVHHTLAVIAVLVRADHQNRELALAGEGVFGLGFALDVGNDGAADCALAGKV
jgi:hypothetical protein